MKQLSNIFLYTEITFRLYPPPPDTIKIHSLIYKSDHPLERVDVWGFGMCFYWLIFGDIPLFDLSKKPLFP